VPIGEPFDDRQSLIVDEQLREVEPGSNGELLTSRPQLSLGYWQDKEKTRLAFVQIVKKLLKIGLTRCDHTREPQAFDDSHLVTYVRRQVICVLLSTESPLIRFYTDEYSRCSTALASYITLLRSFVFACPEQCHGRAIFIGDDLAIRSGPCSCPPHGQGDMVAPVQSGILPHTLGSIGGHEYPGSGSDHKHFLFRPCLSVQWTALRSRWTRG